MLFHFFATKSCNMFFFFFFGVMNKVNSNETIHVFFFQTTFPIGSQGLIQGQRNTHLMDTLLTHDATESDIVGHITMQTLQVYIYFYKF